MFSEPQENEKQEKKIESTQLFFQVIFLIVEKHEDFSGILFFKTKMQIMQWYQKTFITRMC